MQDEVRCSRRTKNYLTQAGLPVNQTNCSQFNRGDNFVYLFSLLLYSAMVDWPRACLEIRLIEVFSFAVILCLLWALARQRWPAMALNLKVNLIMFAVFLPLVIVVVFITGAKMVAPNMHLHSYLASLNSGLFAFGFVLVALCYGFAKKLRGMSSGPAKKEAFQTLAVLTTLLTYGAVAWVVFCIRFAGNFK